MAQLGNDLAVDAAASIRHSSGLGSWERAWRRASPPLRGVVAGYTGYRQHLAAPAPHRGLPSQTLPLVLSFGGPQTITDPQAGRGVTVGSFLAGIHERHVLIDAEVHHGIQVDLSPLAACRLLGQPLRELTGRVVPLDALLGADARRLLDDLACAPDWPSRFHRLDGFLHGLLRRQRALAPEVTRAWERIAMSRGQVRVGELAAEVGWSQRHLSTRFGEALGVTPKRMARLARFEHAATLLSRPARAGLAEIAVAAGYYDQAHFANEVRTFTGLSASQLLARQLPDSGGVFDLDGT